MDIFQQAQTTEQQAPSSVDLTTQLAAIKNDAGEQKYKDVNTALEALKTSQEFIPTLQAQVTSKDAELASLRAQIAQMTSVEQTLANFTTPAPQQAQPEQAPVTPAATLGQADVQSLVQNMLAQQAALQTGDANYQQVHNALVQSHGEQAVEYLQGKATALNTTVDALQEMARTNPVMSMQLLGLSSKPANTPTYGGTNTFNHGTQQPAKLERPTQSLLTMAKQSDVQDFMAKIKAEVYGEHGITA